jgi:hypothetical protein
MWDFGIRRLLSVIDSVNFSHFHNGEGFSWKWTNQKEEFPVVAMFVNGSEWNEQSLYRTFHRCFLPSFGSYEILCWQINRYSRNQMTEQYRTIGPEIQGFILDWRSFYRTCPSVRPMLWWSSRTLTKKSQSQKCFNERKYQYLKYKKKNHSGPDT